MPFGFYEGGCNTFSFGIFLCFSASFVGYKECFMWVQVIYFFIPILSRSIWYVLQYYGCAESYFISILRFDGSNFQAAASSTYAHHGVGNKLGIFREQPFVTGSYFDSNIKTEIFNATSNQWKMEDDYPISGKR